MTYTLKELEEMMANNDGSLDLRYTKITALPEGLTVGEKIKGKRGTKK